MRIYITLSGKCIDLENTELQRTSFFIGSAVFGIFIMQLGSHVNNINVDNVKCVFGSRNKLSAWEIACLDIALIHLAKILDQILRIHDNNFDCFIWV